MNRLSRVLAVSLSVAGLAACASMDEQSARVSPQSATLDRDAAYVGRVEQIARRRGIEVVWVNPPKSDEQLVANE